MTSLALPVPLALCRPVEQVRSGTGLSLEPKFDGWRCQVLARAGRLWSRHGTDLTTPFADVARAAQALPECVLDGELVAVLKGGRVAFSRLQSRFGREPRPGGRGHCAAVGGRPGGPNLPYIAGRSSGWLKWRRTHTSEAAVLGVSGRTPATQCLVLGLVRADGRMRAVGVSLPLAQTLRRELAPVLQPTGADLAELPGTVGGLPGAPPVRYLPVVPSVVVEIEADQERPEEFGRFRHRPSVLRVRGDLTVDLLPPLP
ncbi:ATP-dependent DNA ligase [Streptomyces sp. NPDC054855]